MCTINIAMGHAAVIAALLNVVPTMIVFMNVRFEILAVCFSWVIYPQCTVKCRKRNSNRAGSKS